MRFHQILWRKKTLKQCELVTLCIQTVTMWIVQKCVKWNYPISALYMKCTSLLKNVKCEMEEKSFRVKSNQFHSLWQIFWKSQVYVKFHFSLRQTNFNRISLIILYLMHFRCISRWFWLNSRLERKLS